MNNLKCSDLYSLFQFNLWVNTFQVKLSPAVEKPLTSTSAQKLRWENELECICRDLAVISSSIWMWDCRMGRCTDACCNTKFGILFWIPLEMSTSKFLRARNFELWKEVIRVSFASFSVFNCLAHYLWYLLLVSRCSLDRQCFDSKWNDIWHMTKWKDIAEGLALWQSSALEGHFFIWKDCTKNGLTDKAPLLLPASSEVCYGLGFFLCLIFRRFVRGIDVYRKYLLKLMFDSATRALRTKLKPAFRSALQPWADLNGVTLSKWGVG